MEEKEYIKIGSKIKYRGGFGFDPQTEAVVEGIDMSIYKHCKDFLHEVKKVRFDKRDYCLFYLSNEHWCYGEQIDEIVE